MSERKILYINSYIWDLEKWMNLFAGREWRCRGQRRDFVDTVREGKSGSNEENTTNTRELSGAGWRAGEKLL